MKKILIIFALAFSHFFTVYGQDDKFDKLFEKYQQVEGVTSIKIAKPMFGMLSSLNIDDSQLDQIKPLLTKINGLKILITESPENVNSPGGKKIQSNISQINKDISTYLNNLNYSEVMSVNSKESKIKFLSSGAKEGILDDVLLSIDSGDGGNVLVMLDGKLSMDDLSKIIKSSETKVSSSTNTTRSSFTSESSTSYLNGEARNVGEFSGIQVSTGVNLVYKQESPTSVKVIADADKLQYVITKVENGILKVYVDNKGERNVRFKNLSVNVSSPRMSSVKASSGANFTAVNPVKENRMDIDASSGSTIKGKFNVSGTTDVSSTSGASIKISLNTSSVVVKASSGSDTILEGQATSGVIDISSGASCKAENLRLSELEVESTSGSSLTINVTDKLKAKASSGGSIKYKGNPRIDSNISKVSGGSLRSIN